jgi:hypothetical protein
LEHPDWPNPNQVDHMVEAKPSLPSSPPPPPRVIDQRARKLAVEFSALAAKEKDPERRQDFRELAKLHWNDAYGRRRRYWHPTGRGSRNCDRHPVMPDDSGSAPAA